jgi:hypothetical protein
MIAEAGTVAAAGDASATVTTALTAPAGAVARTSNRHEPTALMRIARAVRSRRSTRHQRRELDAQTPRVGSPIMRTTHAHDRVASAVTEAI